MMDITMMKTETKLTLFNMELNEIKSAVMSGQTVYWANSNYIVKWNGCYLEPRFNIVCIINGWMWGLTKQDGTMNEDPEKFYLG